jgi:hypothetical protein
MPAFDNAQNKKKLPSCEQKLLNMYNVWKRTAIPTATVMGPAG